jgi:hypothetical protein
MDSMATLTNNHIIGWKADTTWHDGFKATVEAYKQALQGTSQNKQ